MAGELEQNKADIMLVAQEVGAQHQVIANAGGSLSPGGGRNKTSGLLNVPALGGVGIGGGANSRKIGAASPKPNLLKVPDFFGNLKPGG